MGASAQGVYVKGGIMSGGNGESKGRAKETKPPSTPVRTPNSTESALARQGRELLRESLLCPSTPAKAPLAGFSKPRQSFITDALFSTFQHLYQLIHNLLCHNVDISFPHQYL